MSGISLHNRIEIVHSSGYQQGNQNSVSHSIFKRNANISLQTKVNDTNQLPSELNRINQKNIVSSNAKNQTKVITCNNFANILYTKLGKSLAIDMTNLSNIITPEILSKEAEESFLNTNRTHHFQLYQLAIDIDSKILEYSARSQEFWGRTRKSFYEIARATHKSSNPDYIWYDDREYIEEYEAFYKLNCLASHLKRRGRNGDQDYFKKKFLESVKKFFEYENSKKNSKSIAEFKFLREEISNFLKKDSFLAELSNSPNITVHSEWHPSQQFFDDLFELIDDELESSDYIVYENEKLEEQFLTIFDLREYTFCC